MDPDIHIKPDPDLSTNTVSPTLGTVSQTRANFRLMLQKQQLENEKLVQQNKNQGNQPNFSQSFTPQELNFFPENSPSLSFGGSSLGGGSLGGGSLGGGSLGGGSSLGSSPATNKPHYTDISNVPSSVLKVCNFPNFDLK